MLKPSAAAIAAATVLMLAGCGEKKTEEKPALPTIHNTMRLVMEPGAETIWDLVSKAYNDVGDGLVGSKLSDDDWKKIGEHARQMKERAQILMDNADKLTVAAADEQIMGSQAVGIKGKIGKEWEAVSADQVHAKIMANPKLFAEKAKVLFDATDALTRAATTHDVAVLYNVSSEMDEVCDGCHEPFWGTDVPPAFPDSAK